MIKCIIFDWGGVCAPGHSIKNFAQNLSAKTGLESEKIEKIFRAMEYPYETGRIKPKQFWNKFRNKLKLKIAGKDIQEIFLTPGSIDQRALDYVLELRKKYRVVLLTNNYEDMLGYLKKKYQIENYFDKIFSSSEIHHKKPEKKAYEFVINNLKINPGEAIFIDDKEKNTEGAKAAGLTTILFKDLDDLKCKIQQIKFQ